MTKDQPHSLEAEESVLSGILLDGVSALSKALDGHLSAASFYKKEHGQVFSTLLWMHKNGRELTLDVMVSELERTSKLESIGGIPFLSHLSKKMPTTAELPYFIERVRETYVLRKLIETSDRIKEMAMSEAGTVEQYAKEVSDIISVRHATQTVKTLATAAQESIEIAKRFADGNATDIDIGLTWPWPEFNNRFGTKLGGQLITVAARPNGGKSTLARQDIMHVAKKYGNVLLFSREMPIEELTFCFAQTLCGHSWKAFKLGKLHTFEKAEFIAALEEVMAMSNLYIFDKDKSLSQIIARAKAFSAMKEVRYIVIDYLQRYDPDQSKGETRDIAIGRMTTAFKDLALDLKIPVLLLCQAGSGIDKEKRDPQLHDLRESGNIGADSDRVIFLVAPNENKVTGQYQDVLDDTLESIYVEALQIKGRADGRSRCHMSLHRPTTTFKSLTK